MHRALQSVLPKTSQDRTRTTLCARGGMAHLKTSLVVKLFQTTLLYHFFSPIFPDLVLQRCYSITTSWRKGITFATLARIASTRIIPFWRIPSILKARLRFFIYFFATTLRWALLTVFIGNEQYTVHFKDLQSGKLLGSSIANTDSLEWANDNKTVFYTGALSFISLSLIFFER